MSSIRPIRSTQATQPTSAQDEYFPVSAQDEYTPSMVVTIKDADKSLFSGNLMATITYLRNYMAHQYNPAKPVNFQVNAIISFRNNSLSMDLFREDRTYTFTDVAVAKRFFLALLEMQEKRMMGAYNKPVPIPLSEAMKSFGLAYKDGQPIPVAQPQANNNPAKTKPAVSAKVQAPVAAKKTVPAPAPVQVTASQNSSSANVSVPSQVSVTPTIPAKAQDRINTSMQIEIRDSKPMVFSSNQFSDLAEALQYVNEYEKSYGLDEAINLEVRVRINSDYRGMHTFKDERAYKFSDLDTCKLFFQALLQIQNERIVNPSFGVMPVILETAMANKGLNYVTGQRLIPLVKKAKTNPVKAQAKAPVNDTPEVPANSQPQATQDEPQLSEPQQQSTTQNKSSLMDFISRHRTDIILSILTAGLYLIYLGVKEIVKQIKNALSHSNGNSSAVLSSTATIDRGGFKVNPNSPTVSSSKVPSNTADKELGSQPLAAKTSELSLSTDSTEEETRQLRC